MAAPPARPPKGDKPWLKGQADDLASLANLDEAILLEELRVRYTEDKIYTYVGDILVAVNPFKRLPIYGDGHAAKYHDKVKSANPPHIYAIADQAYFSLVRNQQDQCAIISGESGAGKTESAKYMIQHIIRLCHVGPEGATLERRIIQVNPLLEAFGNASTLMNHNSSRFGKFTELKFNARGGVVGGRISEYLLEKSRVVKQTPGERNFHVLYYIFSAPNAGQLGLTRVTDFPYVAGGKVNPDNQAMYSELINAIREVGFSMDEEQCIHKTLSAVLHLGCISYDAVYSDHDPAQMSSPPAVLNKIAEMLQLDAAQLKEALTVNITVTRGETIRRPYSCDQANDCRDAFAKALYGRLFGWIVSHINDMLEEENPSNNTKQIGILDIFGFEHFQTNGFEQLCINVANEQLQNFFNDHIFKWELEEYTREGIDAKLISFVDNQPLLDLFFSKPLGVFALLDEESHFPRATDKTFVAKLKQNLTKFKDFVPSRLDDDSFGISHYAGSVTYQADHFLEKNRDSLAADVVSLCQASGNTVVSSIFCGEITETGNVKASSRASAALKKSTASRRSATVGAQFTNSLKILMDKMTKCMAHFVRCIKPNQSQSANLFEPEFVNAQLRYTGMLETTRIRREGYSFRPTFDEFMERFGILAYGPTHRPAASQSTCQKVMQVSGLQNWLMGKTKVFLKYWHVEQLDKQIRVFNDSSAVLQKVCRGFLARKERKKFKLAVREQARQSMLFFDQLSRDSQHYQSQLANQNAADMRRRASGHVFKPSGPPPPKKSEAELKREASIMWWREKEQPIGSGQDAFGNFLPWFHGIIARKEAERMLAPRAIGCFLVRVSENRFGYTLSYRIADRCRHFQVEQDTHGRYALVGIDKVCSSLNELIEYFRRNRINDEGDMLREPCGQEINAAGEEQCDYGELLAPGVSGYRGSVSAPSQASFSGGAPPPISRATKPGSFRQQPAAAPAGGAPPPISRANKPGSFSGINAGVPPPISRSSKPQF
eukprot:m.166316 g.166316  ORF g.166316 m.166316 type:complete len:1002 (-) comp10335_c1_seq28:207-3212(-)